MKKRLESKRIYLIYTILFVAISMCVFAIFVKNKCSFIWEADGLKQHYIILKDFHENIKNFIANPSGGLKLFSWNMGLGLDVIGQYSYYVLGDFFAYLSLLFPVQSLEYVYSFLILLRMFCIGISFIVYGRYHYKASYLTEKQEEKKLFKKADRNILLGAIIYTFSAFCLFAGVRHPYFLNAMILFPMLLLGVDKLLKEDKKVFLCIWVAISAISNYYFFYMHTIMMLIYAIILYINTVKEKSIKHFFKKLGAGSLSYIVGVMIAGLILFPTLYAFLNSARSGEEVVCQYGLDYYKSLFSINLVTVYGENWSYIGVSSIILLMLPILWVRRKEHKVYFTYFILATILLVVPALGSMMNGFSFPNNRWSFMYAFILAYIVTLCLDTQYNKKEIKAMCLFLAFYSFIAIIAVLCIKSMSCFAIYLIQILIAFLMLLAIWYQNFSESIMQDKKKENRTVTFLYGLVITGILIMAYGLYSPYDRNYADEFIEIKKCEEKLATQFGNNQNYAKAIQKILQEDNRFYRISKIPHQVQNLSIYYSYASTECFLSIGNKYVYDLSKELADNQYATTSSIRGMGDRAKITTLLGNKYYVVDEKNESSVPYGYSIKEELEGSKIYENQFSLEIGVCYDQYLLREDYEKLTPIQKEDALLKGAVIDNKDELKNLKLKEVNMEEIKNSSKKIEYQIIDEQDIWKGKNKLNGKTTLKGNSPNVLKTNKEEIEKTTLKVNEIEEERSGEKEKIVVNKKNQKIVLEIPETYDSEIYIAISGFEFQGESKHSVTAKFQGKSVNKTIENKITSAYYQKDTEIVLNLGYYKTAKGKIELVFNTIGTYEFDEIAVVAVPMKSYQEEIEKLKQNELKELKVNNQEITGKSNLAYDGILQIATSYTKGWKAYVDGVKVDTIRVNTAFIGIPVEAGEHEIKLIYEVPYLKEGIIGSIVGVILLAIIVIVEKNLVNKD